MGRKTFRQYADNWLTFQGVLESYPLTHPHEFYYYSPASALAAAIFLRVSRMLDHAP